jgi:predicted transposase YdaD
VNQSFIPDNLREQESDVVYLVPFRGEEVGEVMIYVLIEHQSTASPVMGFRVLFYMVQIWDAQRREWEDNKVPQTQWRFRPIIPIVLYTGSGKWEMPIKMDVLMELPSELRRFVPAFDTLFLNVKWADEQEFLREGHPFGWLLSVIRHENAAKEELEDALRRAVENISQLSEEELHQWKRAMYYLVLLIYHRRSPEEWKAFLALVEQSIKEERRRKEIEEMRQTIAEQLIQEGEEKGELKARREDILRLLKIRFDSVPESVVRKVKSIRRMERLDTLFDKAAIAQSISEMELD